MVGIIMSAFLIGSCNSSGDKKEVADSSIVKDSSIVDSTSQKISAVITLRTVAMTSQNFIQVFTSNRPESQVEMIYFQNSISGTDNALEAHGADGYGQDLTAEIPLSIVADGPTLQFNSGENSYDQQITLGNVRGFLGLRTGTRDPVPPGSFKAVVWLVPCTMIDDNGETLVYYRITEPQNVTTCPASREPNALGRMSTNPSPPAKPCNEMPNGCESEQFMKKYTKKELNEARVKITQ